MKNSSRVRCAHTCDVVGDKLYSFGGGDGQDVRFVKNLKNLFLILKNCIKNKHHSTSSCSMTYGV